MSGIDNEMGPIGPGSIGVGASVVVGVLRREYAIGGFAAAKEAWLECASGGLTDEQILAVAVGEAALHGNSEIGMEYDAGTSLCDDRWTEVTE